MGLSSVTINNYQSASVVGNNQVTHHDTSGNAVDAHAGNLIQVNSTFLSLRRVSRVCYHPGTIGPWCGVKVYQSTDLGELGLRRLSIRRLDRELGRRTAPLPARRSSGATARRCSITPANNNYVLWFVRAGCRCGKLSIYSHARLRLAVRRPSTPGTGCSQQSSATFPGTQPEAPSFYVDGSGNAWAAYTDVASSYAISVIALNSTFTNTTGSAKSIGQAGEGNFIFENGGTTFVGYGSAGCGYCSTATLSYVAASSPLGTYGSAHDAEL